MILMVPMMGFEPIRQRHTNLNRICIPIPSHRLVVLVEGVEPSILSANGLKPFVYANSTTQAYITLYHRLQILFDIFIINIVHHKISHTITT